MCGKEDPKWIQEEGRRAENVKRGEGLCLMDMELPLRLGNRGGHLGVLGIESPRAGTKGILRNLCVPSEMVRSGHSSDEVKSGSLVRQDVLLLL